MQLLLSVSVHSPVPTWGHLSQLWPQALPTVQQHISWVRWVGSACSQPLASDAIRKHWACSAGDSDRGDNRDLFRNSHYGIKILCHSSGYSEKAEDPERPLTHQHIDFCPTPNRPCRNIWSCPVCSGSLHSDRRPAWSTRWYLQGWKVVCKNEKGILIYWKVWYCFITQEL